MKLRNWKSEIKWTTMLLFAMQRWMILLVLMRTVAYAQDEGPSDCAAGEFACQSGICIPMSKYNNSVNDCQDNSDEVHAPCRNPAYSCKNGNCIVIDWVLDGRNDCIDGSDEVKLIGTSCLMIIDCCYCDDYVPHSECLSGVCQCSSGFYNDTLGTECIRRIIGDDCVADRDCYNAFDNSHCWDGYCTCDTGYYASEDHSTCVRRLVGDSCTVNIDCSTLITNSNCTDRECMCNSGYYQSPDRTICVKRKLRDSCKYQHDCASAMKNSVCWKLPASDLDKTRDPDTRIKKTDDKKSSKVCACDHGYNDLPKRAGCTVRKIGEQCQRSRDCVIRASRCQNTTCVCKMGHYPSRKRDECVRNTIGDPCESDRNCTSVIKNSYCLSKMCVCEMGFRDIDYGAKCENRDSENIAIIAGSIVAIGTLVVIDVVLIILIVVHFVI